MKFEEYRKMAEVEGSMWYYRALHRNVVGALTTALRADEASVLDAGCGTGGLLMRLRRDRPQWTLTGLDFSPLACELARERASTRVVTGSIEALPFPEERFDAVISCDVVCQVAEPVQAVQEFFRVLRPGGILVMTMPAYQWMFSYHDQAVGNLRRYSRNEVGCLLAKAGFHLEVSTYWNMLPFPFAVLRRKLLPGGKADSDVALFPAPVEAAFNAMMVIEKQWLDVGGVLPCGSSVLTVAKK
jgi:SAM-dependent methyltransferase